MSDLDPVMLQIDSQQHTGWQEIRIRLSLEQMADEFELTLTERWSETVGVRPISLGQPCTVSIGSDLVVTGFVDEVLPDYDAERHTIVVRGRSKACDLIDCSGRDRRFDGRTLLQIAQALAAPFDIEVRDEVGASKPFRAFALEDGQPIAEAIERAAQIRGARVVSDAEGRLLIVHAVQREVATPLELGRNVLRARGEFSDRDRFNRYEVEGQTPGDDDWHGDDAAAPSATATDPRIRAPRSTLIVSDTPADSVDCRARAELESRRRWAAGRGATYTVNGWRHDKGLWRPGDAVSVIDRYMGVDERMLVSEVQLIESGQGRTAELRVAPPAAFEPVPIPEPQEATSSGGAGGANSTANLGWG